MAITGNNSSEKTVREKTVYTGLADCKVLAINPNLAKLKSLGINAQSEPEYIGADGRVRVDIWLKTENEAAVTTKLSIWLENVLRESSAGKPQWINKYGRTAWFNDESEAQSWFLLNGVRQAYKGEENLHKFLQAYLNTIYNTRDKIYDECQIDNMEGLLKGDLSELQSILTAYPDNTVRVLFGAKITEDGKVYQNVFNKFFEKTCVKPNYKNWDADACGDYGFKADIQNSFEFQEYLGTPSVGGPTADQELPNEVDAEDEF